MKKYIPEINTRYGVKLVLLFFAYFFTAKVGLAIHPVHTFATLIWLPTGISLAALILYGYNLWPAILIGAFFVNSITGAPLLAACGIAIGNTLEAVVGTYLLRTYIDLYRCFERLRDTLGFIGICALGATLISATFGTVSLLLGKVITPAYFLETWFVWWIGDALGALVITPFLLTWLAPTRPWNADHTSLSEIIFFFITIFGLNYVIFWQPIIYFGTVPLVYLISLPLIWGGLRFGSRGMTFSILVTSFTAVSATILGQGPFIRPSVSESLLFLQIFIGTVSITFLIFLSVVKERKLATHRLEDHIDKLEEAVEQISSADQAKNNFLAILAHELRNPLAPILSSIELLKIRTQEPIEISRIVSTMNTHVSTMVRLLDDLLDISRISREKFTLETKMFAVQEAVERSLERVDPLIKTNNHNLSVFMPRKPLHLFADQLRVEQIIVNLLNNAAKYTPVGGKINITVTQSNNSIFVSIQDTGIGIEEHMLSKIFEPFLQVNKERALTHGGLGIGLSLSKKLAEMHGGTISAKSEGKGKGAIFTVALPTPQNSAKFMKTSPGEKNKNIPTALKPGQTRPQGRSQKCKILVVDDNKAAAQGLGKLLQHKKHIVELAYEGETALKKAKSFYPDVVLLDIGLPVMDGYEVAKKIREKISGSMTLIALTGYGQNDDKKKAAEAGFDYHLTKPVSIVDIEKILKSI